MTDPKKAQPTASIEGDDPDYPRINKSIYRYVLRHTLRGQLFLLLLTALTMPLVYISLDIPKSSGARFLMHGRIEGMRVRTRDGFVQLFLQANNLLI